MKRIRVWAARRLVANTLLIQAHHPEALLHEAEEELLAQVPDEMTGPRGGRYVPTGPGVVSREDDPMIHGVMFRARRDYRYVRPSRAKAAKA